MGWFSSAPMSINETRLINENSSVEWRIKYSNTTLVSLFVQRLDGYGPTVMVIPASEYNNYKRGLAYKVISDLSFENIERFSAEANLARGMYYLVVSLPAIPDGWDSYSQFNIRYETVK